MEALSDGVITNVYIFGSSPMAKMAARPNINALIYFTAGQI